MSSIDESEHSALESINDNLENSDQSKLTNGISDELDNSKINVEIIKSPESNKISDLSENEVKQPSIKNDSLENNKSDSSENDSTQVSEDSNLTSAADLASSSDSSEDNKETNSTKKVNICIILLKLLNFNSIFILQLIVSEAEQLLRKQLQIELEVRVEVLRVATFRED